MFKWVLQAVAMKKQLQYILQFSPYFAYMEPDFPLII